MCNLFDSILKEAKLDLNDDMLKITKMSKAEEVKDLEEKISKYQKSYYDGAPEISDAEFDSLWDKLELLEPDSEIFSKVGADNGTFRKEKHLMPMGSQQKAQSEQEFIDWATKMGNKTFIVSQKLDGSSLELQYKNGKLVDAVTRGNGIIGDSIYNNAIKFKEVVLDLKENFTGAVRGEVLMEHAMLSSNHSDKANCRNAAAGVMKRKDGSGCEDLLFMPYDALCTTNESYFSSYIAILDWLKDKGFYPIPAKTDATIQDIIDMRTTTKGAISTFGYDMDGLVVRTNKINHADAKRARPMEQIALKFELDEAETTLIDVFWSKNGSTLTPVAVCNPVRLNGTTVQKASLANLRIMKELDLKIGSKVILVKRGEIIPKIMKKSPQDKGQGTPIIIPTKCPTCLQALKAGDVFLQCVNPSCNDTLKHRIMNWVKEQDIFSIGPAIIDLLFEADLVTEIADLYLLDESHLNRLGRLGDKSAEKIVRNIQDKKEITFAKFIGGLDITGFGTTLAERVAAAGYDTIAKLENTTVAQLSNVNGVGFEMANKLLNGIKTLKGEIDNLLKYVTIKTTNKITGGKLIGKSFCFTGSLYTMKRAEAEAKVKAASGTVAGVSNRLTYLVTNDKDSGSAKNVKAQSLGVKLIDEKEFTSML